MNTPQAKSDIQPLAKTTQQNAHPLKERIVSGGKRFIAIFLYLWLVFALFTFHEYIILAQRQIEFTHYGFAAINALVMAKVILIGEELHLGGFFQDRPLIYPILANSVLFAILLIACLALEHVIDGLWHGQTIVESLPSIGGGGLTGVILVGVILTVALMPFFAFSALERVIGGALLYALMFRRGPNEVIVEVTFTPQDGGNEFVRY